MLRRNPLEHSHKADRSWAQTSRLITYFRNFRAQSEGEILTFGRAKRSVLGRAPEAGVGDACQMARVLYW